MQKLSLFSCGVTVFTSPIILFLDTSATPLGPKIGIAVTLVAFGVFTTGRPTSCASQIPCLDHYSHMYDGHAKVARLDCMLNVACVWKC